MGVHDSVHDAATVDLLMFRRYFHKIGRAYRGQATTLVELCRFYAETSSQTYTEHDRLQNFFRLADAALSAAAEAKQGTTDKATNAFLLVQDEITQFGAPPRKDTPGDSKHRRSLADDPRTALAKAAQKDEKTTTILSKLKSVFKAPESKGPVKKVNFVILKSPHQRLLDQSIIRQEIDTSTTTTEIVWRFSQYRKSSAGRIAFKQNPHFYDGLPDNAARYGSKFDRNPLNDFASVYHRKIETIYVLVDKSCRLFLDKPPIQRVFGNLWKPDQTVILKDFVGKLESEDIVLRDIGENQDYWYRTADPSQRRGESNDSGLDSIIVQKPVENERAVVNAAVRTRNLDIMIRDPTMPVPDPAEWKRLPSLTKQEPRIVSTSTLGSDTLSATSTAVNPSDPSLLMPVDPRGLRVNVELRPASDITLRTAPAGDGDATTELPPLPEQESQSANPGGARRGWRNPGSMFSGYALSFLRNNT